MRHFVFEFITGGGLSEQELPEKLVKEGDLMVRALVNDLTQLPDINVMLCRDSRLNAFNIEIEHCFVKSEPEREVIAALQPDDIVWLIAPETEGCLVAWVELFLKQPVKVLISDAETLRTCSSKFKTMEVLKQQRIPVLETVFAGQDIPKSRNGWVIKPDDGAGAEGVRVFTSEQQLQSFFTARNPTNWVIQPRIEGTAMSMSMLCYEGHVVVVGCNLQEVDMNSDVITLNAIGVNKFTDSLVDFLHIARDIAKAMPGLFGYIGVDLIKTIDNGCVVVEINPRLTTAYVGLSESIGINMAAQIIDTFQSGIVPTININQASMIRIPL